MNIFSWNETFDVGVELINDQHKKLIKLINELSQAMSEGKSSEVLGAILKDTINYGIYHFDTEEELFHKYNYEATKEHMLEHESFKARVQELMEEFEAGSYRVSIETLHFLKDWITKHIKTTDMKYKDFLSAKI